MSPSLPARPSLRHLRTQSRDLLKAFRSGDLEARSRFRSLHPRLQSLTDEAVSEEHLVLADAQLAIARDYDFESWAKMKQHVLAERVEAFRKAVQERDYEGVARCLADETFASCINDPIFDFDCPAIVWVSNRGDVRVLEMLIEHGADVNAKSKWWAGASGVLHGTNRAKAEFLMSKGARLDIHASVQLEMRDELEQLLDREPDLIDARGPDGQTPIHFARTPVMAQLLIDRGADLDVRDLDHGGTAIQSMVVDRPEIAQLLIDQGAEVDIFAHCSLGNVDLVKSAIRDDPTLMRAKTCTPRFMPVEAPGAHRYAYTLGAKATPLHVAARCGQILMIDALIELGADVNVRGWHDESTPLHMACWFNQPEAVRSLIGHGAEVDARSGKEHNNTSFGWAIISGAVEPIPILIESGAVVAEEYLEAARRGISGELDRFRRASSESRQAVLQVVESALNSIGSSSKNIAEKES